MSQVPKLTRARQLAGSVWPGRAVDGYANLIVARLRKLAAAKSTGMLPFSGHGEGGIFFRDGRVVYAESSRTPGRNAGGLAALGLGPAEQDPEPDGPRSLGWLTAELARAEATVDAALDLVSSESRYAKFRPDEVPAAGHACDIPLETLLTEVERRRRVLRQLASIVTADTTVVRDAQMTSPSLQVSALQWSLLVRVRAGATARDLAIELNRGVFGTTIEVYRLLALGLLSAPGYDVKEARDHDVVSFIRAASEER